MFTCTLKADKFIQSSFRNILINQFVNLSEDNLFNIALATGEALQNIVRYGYQFQDHKEVRLTLKKLDALFVIHIMDDAPYCPIESFMHRDITPSDHGGMGLTIIRKLTHTFEIQPSNKGNTTILTFSIR